MSVLAPYITTYASRTPYITAQEWLNAPTGIDAGSLVPGMSRALNDAQLAQTIVYASSMVDLYCDQVLAATMDIDPVRRYRVDRWGKLRVPLARKPILEIIDVQVGDTPSQMASIGSLTDVAFLGRNVIEIPVGIGPSQTTTGFSWGPGIGARMLVQVTYVNGYPNTLTAASSMSGSASFVVESTAGVYPGTMLTVSDGASTEQVAVAPPVAGTTLTATEPLTFAHGAGVSVSNLPPAVKQATILLTTALIKTRGSEAFVMASMTGAPSEKTSTEAGGLQELDLAKGLLAPLRRVT